MFLAEKRVRSIVSTFWTHFSTFDIMDIVRDNLMSKLEQFVAQVLENASTSTGAQVQIEAIIVGNESGDGASQPRRRVLKTISLDDLQYSLAHSARRIAGGDNNHRVSNPQSLSNPERHPTGEFSSPTKTQRPALEPHAPDDQDVNEDGGGVARRTSRRKMVGGLRLGHSGSSCNLTPPRTPTPPNTRQLETDERHFPKRRKLDKEGPAKLQKSTVDKLIEGIWEQIHKPRTLALGPELNAALQTIAERIGAGSNVAAAASADFGNASRCCRQITCGSRTARALEVIIQAHWIDCYDARIAALGEERPDLRVQEHKKMVLTEACTLFSWSEKELRNRM